MQRKQWPTNILIRGLAFLLLAVGPVHRAWAAEGEVSLPKGVKVVWDLDRAHRDKPSTRERVCLNGLWRWQPARAATDTVPADRWGFFKVPGFWPGTTNYIQEDC